MKGRRIGSKIVRYALALLVGLPAQASARSGSPQEGRLDGDWEVRVDFNGNRRTSILSFSRDPDGHRIGQWISSWGMSELENISYDGGKLRFTREGRNREGRATTWKFTGTIAKGKLSGTVSSGENEYKIEARRVPPLPDIVGDWAFSFSNERVGFALAVRVDKEGRPTAHWRTADGEVPTTDLEYEEGKLTFTSKIGNYKGHLRRANSLDGVYTTDRGDYPVLAHRMGTPIIGTWDLDVTSERGSRKQRLKVRPDMSGWYGAVPIERVHLEGEVPVRQRQEGYVVTFKAAVESGERTMEMSFAGKVADSKLTGEITTPRGRAKVAGKKVVETARTRTAR